MMGISKLSLSSCPDGRYHGPRIIGHRVAAFHSVENTLTSFTMASQLGADLWELDVRLTKDGVCVVSHDDDLMRVFAVQGRISALDYSQIRAISECSELPLFSDVVTFAKKVNTGLYIRLRNEEAGVKVLQLLREQDINYAVIVSNHLSWLVKLVALHCEYLLSMLMVVSLDRLQTDLVSQGQLATLKRSAIDIIHFCKEDNDKPIGLITPQQINRIQHFCLDIVLWREECPELIRQMMALPVFAVCSARPELLVPYPTSLARPYELNQNLPLKESLPKLPEIVCHRGAEHIAPENTLAAVQRVYEQGLDWVEIDIQQTLDGELIVLHDHSLDRTSNGVGAIAEQTATQIKSLDAGSYFSPKYQYEKIPFLIDIIKMAKHYGRSLYIEIKGACAEKVLQLVIENDFLTQCFFWSFDSTKIDAIRKISTNANLMVRAQDFDSIERAVQSVKANVVEIEMTASDVAEKIQQARDLGCLSMLCYQGDDLQVFEKIYELAPDLVNLNRPDMWKEVVYYRQFPDVIGTSCV